MTPEEILDKHLLDYMKQGMPEGWAEKNFDKYKVMTPERPHIIAAMTEYASLISKEKDEEIKGLQDAIIYLHNKLYILRNSKNAVAKYVKVDCEKAYDRACKEVLIISKSIAQQALKP